MFAKNDTQHRAAGPRILSVVAGLSLLATLCALGPIATSSASKAPTTYLYNCTTRESRPTSIVLTCADANRSVTNITWHTWGAATATASGTLRWNDCTPTCAGGKFHTRSITFTAGARKTIGGVSLYTTLHGPKGAWGMAGEVWLLPTKSL